MDTDKPISLLEDCEKGLRTAAAAALEGGEYGRARQIMAWAENVASMLMVARGQSAAERLAAQTGEALEDGVSGGRGTARVLAAPGDEYPRFLRRGDELVKIGWSKSDRAEYQHRAPRRAVDAVIARLNSLATRGAGFSSEYLTTLKDTRTDGIFPAYQIFVALAWLRKLGVVTQKGRKSGYTMRTDVSLDEVVTEGWEHLVVTPD